MGDHNLIGLVLTALALAPGKIPLALILIAYVKNRHEGRPRYALDHLRIPVFEVPRIQSA